jgi:dipeptidyl aminopeptidase/acylaminoacyl peptidase
MRPAAGAESFLFGMDEGGSEFYQLYRFDMETGKHAMLSDGKSRNVGAVFSHDGNQIAYSSTRRNGRDFDIYVSDPAEPGSTRMVYEAQGYWSVGDWSPDGKQIAVAQYVSINETHPRILDIATGKATPLLPDTGEKVYYGDVLFSRDGHGIYYTSDQEGEFVELYFLELGRERSKPLSRHIPWNVESLDLSPNGSILAFTANEDGISRLHLLDTKSGREMAQPDLPEGQISGLEFHPKLNEIGFTFSSAREPGDVWSYDIGTKKLTRWTRSEVGGLDTSSLSAAELIHYPTFDQVDGKPRMIPALLTKPSAKFKAPYPVLLNIHGGPEGQTRPGFSSQDAYLTNEMGIAVIRPNVRGSTGYGKSYTQLDNGFKREDSVKDIGALLDWIATQPELDASRVAVTGGSYGGYMSLAAMTHYSDRLKCGIEIVGISSFATFLRNTQDYRRDLRRAEYGDERDPKMLDFFETISPLNNAQKITVPMLVAQGKNDPRVPYTESEQIVEKVRANGGEVWYMLAADEGHGFAKKENRDYYGWVTMLFLEKHLLN